MWTRADLKQKGKAAVKRNYWKCVLMAFIYIVLVGGGAKVTTSGNDALSTESISNSLNSAASQAGVSVGLILGILAGIVGIALLVSFVWYLFLTIPVSVGINRFFLVNTESDAEIGELGYAYMKGRLFKTIGANILVNIFVTLWSLLLVIPGIVKIYQYRMVNYILADNPELGVMDCLRRSKEMTRGHKWNMFVLDLSFIGWQLLSGITCGILGVFYVNPYVQATNAELYVALKENV